MTEITTTQTPNARQAPAAAYLASLATEPGRAGMRSELVKVARLMGAADWQTVDWATLNAANVAAILANTFGAPATKNKTRAALRGVARSAWRMGIITSEELARINDVKGAKGSRDQAGRAIEAWELAAIMRTIASDRDEGHKVSAAIRDAAIIAIAAKTGARRDELAGIMRSELECNADCTECTIKVIGKGNKQRTLFVDNGAMTALCAWLAITKGLTTTDPLFAVISQIGVIGKRRLSNVAMHKMLTRRAEAAGVKGVSWHDFRRTFAGVLLDLGEDISTVAQLMGHSNVATTQRYDRRPQEARRKAARKISVPVF